MKKKLCAIILSVCLIFSIPLAVSAKEEYTTVPFAEKAFYQVIQQVADMLIFSLARVFPTPESWSGDVPEGFMEGTTEFLDEPVADSVWSLGYDSRSILPEKEAVIGKLYVAGTIEFKDKKATSVEDDLKVRTVALSDGSGRGISVFAAIDSYGMSLSDVREIRTRLSSLAKEKNINSITVFSLHQHSAVDTFGMNGNIFDMVLVNPYRIISDKEIVNGKDEGYMENLFEVCSLSIEAALENMTEGKMYYGAADASDYINDKRQPYVNDSFFNRLRFVPSDNSPETWLVSSEIHCTGNGAAGTAITGDYPYYAEKEINSAYGANVMFFMGALQSNNQKRSALSVAGYRENMSSMELIEGFGKSVAQAVGTIEAEKEIAPLLNIKYKELALSVDNPVLLLAAKAGLFENIVRIIDGKETVITEIGYMEMGEELAFSLIPGELAPELAHGGTLEGEYSWSGESWNYPSMQETVRENRQGRKLIVMGLANDQTGYIVPSNNYIPMIHSESGSIEFVSLGKNTAEAVISAFSTLVINS